jgi:DNA-binding transcriptional LysR family regulator
MNLNQLKIFYLAAKRGNLSKAAEDLCITQPAMTKGIQRIQQHYDIRLLDRIGKKMVLTDAGEVLFNIAEKIFELEKHAEEGIREFKQRKKGMIRIQASESFGAYYLPSIRKSTLHRVLHEFIEKNEITVTWPLELSSNRAIKQAVESGLGIALISRKVADDEIQTGRLKAIPLPNPSIKRKFYLVHHKQKYISDMLQSLINQVDQWACDYARQIA